MGALGSIISEKIWRKVLHAPALTKSDMKMGIHTGQNQGYFPEDDSGEV